MNETFEVLKSLRPGTFFEKQTNLSLLRKIPEYVANLQRRRKEFESGGGARGERGARAYTGAPRGVQGQNPWSGEAPLKLKGF